MNFHRSTQYQPILKGNQLTRAPCHPSRYEQGQSTISKQTSWNEEGFITTYSSASKIKVIHTMILRLITSWSKIHRYFRSRLVGCILFLVIRGLHWRKEGTSRAMLKSYGSWYSMSRTYGPQDMISLVIPRLGDNIWLQIRDIYSS